VKVKVPAGVLEGDASSSRVPKKRKSIFGRAEGSGRGIVERCIERVYFFFEFKTPIKVEEGFGSTIGGISTNYSKGITSRSRKAPKNYTTIPNRRGLFMIGSTRWSTREGGDLPYPRNCNQPRKEHRDVPAHLKRRGGVWIKLARRENQKRRGPSTNRAGLQKKGQIKEIGMKSPHARGKKKKI